MVDRPSGRTDGRFDNFDARNASRRDHSRRTHAGQYSSNRSSRRDSTGIHFPFDDGSRADARPSDASRRSRQRSANPRRPVSSSVGSERDASAFGRSRYGTQATRDSSSGRTRGHSSLHDSPRMAPHDASRAGRSSSSRSARGAGRSFEIDRRGGRSGDARRMDESRYGRQADISLSQKRGRSKRIIAIAAAVVLVVVLVGAGVAFSYANSISNNLHQGIDDDLRSALVQTDMAKEPFYLLLLGTDGSTERYGDDGFGGIYRSDSIMLTRIDPVEKKVALVSLPRDTKVDLGGEYGEQKINAAYGLGGPAMTVKTVADLAGVDISHYASVDFDGFAGVVDALGGIEVDVPVDIDDSDAGNVSLKAGLQTLNGEQALVLCRSRNTYADTAAQPDAMRAANQRLVLAAIARKLLDSDVATIASSVQALSQFVTTDLELTDIIGLAQAMKGLDAATDIYTAAAPTTSQYVDDIWWDILDEQEWKAMMRRVKDGLPPTEETLVDHATGTIIASAGTDAALSRDPKYSEITVKNGTDIEGLAAMTRNVLMSYGYQNVVIGDINADFDYPETLIIYDDPSQAYEASEIVQMIGQGKAIENDGEIRNCYQYEC